MTWSILKRTEGEQSSSMTKSDIMLTLISFLSGLCYRRHSSSFVMLCKFAGLGKKNNFGCWNNSCCSFFLRIVLSAIPWQLDCIIYEHIYIHIHIYGTRLEVVCSGRKHIAVNGFHIIISLQSVVSSYVLLI